MEAEPTTVGVPDAPTLLRAAFVQRTGRKVKPQMKADPDFSAAEDHAYAVTARELRQIVERYEALEDEKKDVARGQKDLMADAKARGYDTKVLRKLIALRKRKPDEVAEEEAVLDLYRQALDMA